MGIPYTAKMRAEARAYRLTHRPNPPGWTPEEEAQYQRDSASEDALWWRECRAKHNADKASALRRLPEAAEGS